MPTAITVNRSTGGEPRKHPVSRKDRIASLKVMEHVDATTPTLARESRHIVVSSLSGTTSRAVVLFLEVSNVRRKRSGALSAPGEG